MTREALIPWFRTLVRSVRSDAPDLSARQMAILLAVYLDPEPHTIRGLAQQLHISKPAVTRAIDTLAHFEFVRRMPDESDGRSVLIQRTVKGSVHVDKLATEFLSMVRGDAV